MLKDENINPLVTFVVPAFNAAAVLPRALESLLAQTRDNWEAVVVDDGSSDDTAIVAERVAVSDGRIRVIRQANAGVSCARNAVIRAARGEYLGFLDADDTVEPDFVEKVAELAAGSAPDVLALAYRAMPRGNTFGYGEFDGVAADFLIRALSDKYATFPCWMFAISRRLICENGIEFVEGRRTGEDQEFVLKALVCAGSCRSVAADDVFYVYRTESETSAMGRNLEGQFDYPRAMLGVREFFDVRGSLFDPQAAEQIEGLLNDRFIGACSYATEMALTNGAADKDVLAWIGKVLDGCRDIGLDFDQLRCNNRLFLRLWLRARSLLPCCMRMRTGLYRVGGLLRGF